jgi:hypothetical protein
MSCNLASVPRSGVNQADQARGPDLASPGCAARLLARRCRTAGEQEQQQLPGVLRVSTVTLLSRGVAHVIDQVLACSCFTGRAGCLSW